MYECLDIVGINNPCVEETYTYLLDELGISLADAAHQSDERYFTGQKLIDAKVLLAKNDVIDYLTLNVDEECDTVKLEELICSYSNKVAKAIWYRAAALIYKDLALDSSRYNEYVAYNKDNAIVSALLYDSSFEVLAQMAGITTEIKKGQYQMELSKLQTLVNKINELCCPTDCSDRYYIISIP